MRDVNNTSIILVVAHEGYQPIEYSVTKKILEDAGITTTTASNKGRIATAKDDSSTMIDISTDNIDMAKYDGIFFIGGPGAMENLDNEISYKVIQKAAELSKPLGSICISTRILAKAGALDGKKATGWDGDNELAGILEKYKAIYIKEKVVVDDTIITATDPSAAKEFGEAILKIVKK